MSRIFISGSSTGLGFMAADLLITKATKSSRSIRAQPVRSQGA